MTVALMEVTALRRIPDTTSNKMVQLIIVVRRKNAHQADELR
jgi:hypothetical protein